MVVRFYPGRKKERSNALARFLATNHVEYELARPEELARRGTRLYGAGEEPVVEIDGKMFVNPNTQALVKALEGDSAD
ncbi:MAG: hypothetical protein ACRD2J_02250 [Thermoanaerobaculia bacterium]